MKAKITFTAEYEIEGNNQDVLESRIDILRQQITSPLSNGVDCAKSSFRIEKLSDDGIPTDFSCYDTGEGIQANNFLNMLCRRMKNEIEHKKDQQGAFVSLRNCFDRYLNATQFSGKESGMWDSEPRNKLLDFATKITVEQGYDERIVHDAFADAQVRC